MELKLTEKKILEYEIYDKPFLYWSVGFHYYVGILELKNPEYTDPVAVYLNGGSITYDLKPSDTFDEKIRKTIEKSKILRRGKDLFKKIKLKLSDEVCKYWCEHTVAISTLSVVGAENLFHEQSEQLIEALEWFFDHFKDFKLDIPETVFVVGGALAIAALFLKINKNFNKHCRCEERRKLEEIERNGARTYNDIPIPRVHIKVIRQPLGSSEKKVKIITPVEKLIKTFQSKLNREQIIQKEFDQLRRIIEDR